MKQEIIKRGIKDHYFNLVKKSNFENCLVVSSKGNFKRNYEKTFIDGLNDQINIFYHEINEYPNFSNINQSLKEAKRVLKTGGRIFCLEFSKVENEILKKLYKTYSKSIPHIGKYITGKSEPYQYLVNSIDKFYNQEELSEIFKKNGFHKIEYRNLSGGIAAIHSGWKI